MVGTYGDINLCQFNTEFCTDFCAFNIKSDRKSLKRKALPPLWKGKSYLRIGKSYRRGKSYSQFFPKGSIITKNRPLGRAAPIYSISQQIIVVCRVAKVYLG